MKIKITTVKTHSCGFKNGFKNGQSAVHLLSCSPRKMEREMGRKWREIEENGEKMEENGEKMEENGGRWGKMEEARGPTLPPAIPPIEKLMNLEFKYRIHRF